MCQEIYFSEGNRNIHTLRDLLTVIDRKHIVLGEHYQREGQSRDEAMDEMLDSCLCPYDIEATFASVSEFVLEPTRTIPEYVIHSVKTSQAIASVECTSCNTGNRPTLCTDGWFHLFDDGRTVACTRASGDEGGLE